MKMPSFPPGNFLFPAGWNPRPLEVKRSFATGFLWARGCIPAMSKGLFLSLQHLAGAAPALAIAHTNHCHLTSILLCLLWWDKWHKIHGFRRRGQHLFLRAECCMRVLSVTFSHLCWITDWCWPAGGNFTYMQDLFCKGLYVIVQVMYRYSGQVMLTFLPWSH